MAFYFDNKPESKSCEQLIRCEINGSIYNFYTDNDVFSKKYLDFGTRTLLEGLDLTYTQYVVMMYLWENKETNIKECITDTQLYKNSKN